MKYRKKPVVIEAIQFEIKEKFEHHNIGSLSSANKIADWSLNMAYPAEYNTREDVCYAISVKTLEGFSTCNPGDWIIKGVEGEFYSCKDSVFQKTHEKVIE